MRETFFKSAFPSYSLYFYPKNFVTLSANYIFFNRSKHLLNILWIYPFWDPWVRTSVFWNVFWQCYTAQRWMILIYFKRNISVFSNLFTSRIFFYLWNQYFIKIDCVVFLSYVSFLFCFDGNHSLFFLFNRWFTSIFLENGDQYVLPRYLEGTFTKI